MRSAPGRGASALLGGEPEALTGAPGGQAHPPRAYAGGATHGGPQTNPVRSPAQMLVLRSSALLTPSDPAELQLPTLRAAYG